MTSAEHAASPDLPELQGGGVNAWFASADYARSVPALLGGLAAYRLRDFEALARLGAGSASLTDRLALDRLAAAAHDRFRLAARHLGADRQDPDQGPAEAVAPFLRAAAEFQRRTRTADWHEGIIAQYVDGGVSADFYRDLAAAADPQTRDLVVRLQEPTGFSEWVVRRFGGEIAADSRLAGRLSLWGRRLAGESLSRIQDVALAVPGLPALVIGAEDREAGGRDLAETSGERTALALAHVFSKLTAGHSARMSALGLTA